MKLLLSIVLSLAAALGCGTAGAAGEKQPASQINFTVYSLGKGAVELFAADFSLPSDKRNEPLELFQEARAQCQRIGFATARRTEVKPAVLKWQGREVSGSLLRYSCTNSL